MILMSMPGESLGFYASNKFSGVIATLWGTLKVMSNKMTFAKSASILADTPDFSHSGYAK